MNIKFQVGMIDVFEEDDVNTGSGDKFLKVFEEVNKEFAKQTNVNLVAGKGSIIASENFKSCFLCFFVFSFQAMEGKMSSQDFLILD